MTGRWRCAIIVCSIAGLVWLLAARAFGPSDLWDQTQPKTVSYTTDIIVHGGSHWLLPIERAELPATKPPLYNWIAVPAVRLFGFDREIAHKLPSVIALLGCWLIVVRVGRSLDAAAGGDEGPQSPALRHSGSPLGWLAGLIFVACPSTFKLGYLARPDMLLTLWLLIAWWIATRVFVQSRDQGENARTHLAPAMVFWLAIALAGLTKGPAALVGVIYAIVAARVLGGRWAAIGKLYPLMGLPIVMIICGAWVFAVWKINPTHVRDELWFNEIWGRVTGTGAEGTHHGTRQWLRELPYQGAYYMTRFAPWSFVALAALFTLIRTRASRIARQPDANINAAGAQPALAASHHPSPLRAWMLAATTFALITLGLFTLSTGKRADYIAIAFPQSALLAAWWLLRSPPRIAQRLPWLVLLTAAGMLAGCTWFNLRQPTAPVRGFGDAILRFARQANAAIAADPAPVYTVGAGQTHLQAIMGIADSDARHDLPAIITRSNGAEFWVVAGRLQNPPHEFDRWLAQQRRLRSQADAVVRSESLPLAEGWQEQVTLWRVRPR